MAVSDVYGLQYILQESQGCEPIEWQESSAGYFLANHRGVRIEMGSCSNMAGPRLYLRLSHDDDQTYIEEPANLALFGRRYRDEESQRAAELIRTLAGLVAAACAERRERAFAARDRIRQDIYQRLLFGPVSSGAQENDASGRLNGMAAISS